MIHKNTWKPDTCGCEIDFVWDDQMSEEERVHTPTSAKLCQVHSSLDVDSCWSTVLEENRRKNYSIGLIKERHPEKSDNDIEWNFDSNRVLKVIIKNEKKNLDVLKNEIEGRFEKVNLSFD